MKKKTWKVLCGILLSVMCFALIACGKTETVKEEPKEDEVTEEMQETPNQILDDDAEGDTGELLEEEYSDEELMDQELLEEDLFEEDMGEEDFEEDDSELEDME